MDYEDSCEAKNNEDKNFETSEKDKKYEIIEKPQIDKNLDDKKDTEGIGEAVSKEKFSQKLCVLRVSYPSGFFRIF